MTWRPVFQVDTDAVRSVTKSVTYKALTGNVATLTATAHGFSVGWVVLVSDVGTPFDGTFTITSTTADTFTYDVIGENVATTAVSGGIATSPAPAYLRYTANDVVLDNIAYSATFYAETWDYHTIRVIWGLDDVLEARVLKDVSVGRVPRIAITRSAFGYPVTPLDGEKIFDRAYTEVVPSLSRTKVPAYFETQPVVESEDWQRPTSQAQSFYDRNLRSGQWYYYSLFFYVGSYDKSGNPLSDPKWILANSMDALTPVNHKHGEKLYGLLPPYYQSKDQEFTAGTGLGGVIQRLLSTVGLEMDYTKTLADGLEHVYDIDYLHDDLLHALGETNFGVAIEGGLGDIRYRSLLATVSRLYDERGSVNGLRKMTEAATKYRCKVLEGINLMNLTDDSEFASGTGAWGSFLPTYSSFVSGQTWQGSPGGTFNTAVLSSESLLTTPSGESAGYSLVAKRNAMKVDKASGSAANKLLITCGLNVGSLPGRRHEAMATHFYPRLHGIRCNPGTVYTFSMYSTRISGSAGSVSVGIMWFNDPEDNVFDIDNDFIDKSETTDVSDVNTEEMERYSVTSVAPLSLRGQAHVYAVPYILFSNSAPRYVSACLFNAQLNSAESFAVVPDIYLTLGIENETLGSDYVLGTP